MRILFTGSTSKQTSDTAHEKARVKRIDDSSIIVNSLRKQGHIVDRREVQHGEDLSKYDLGIVGVGALGSSNYGNIFSALYAIGNLKKVIVFHEDWKIQSSMMSFIKTITNQQVESHIAKRWSNGNHFYSNITRKVDVNQIYKTLQNIYEGKYNCLVPAYNWGNKDIVADILNVKPEKVHNIDLTPYTLKSFGIEEVEREHDKKEIKYMLASLADHSPWVKKQKFYHEVDYYGCKKLKAPMLKDEKDVFDTMSKYWGILSPKYPHAGSGWYRARFIYSALNYNVLIMDPKDSLALGLQHFPKIEPYHDWMDLLEVAKEQRNAIMKYYTTETDFDNKINQIVNRI